MKETLKKLWKDESAQGATEYILILVIIVGVALAFKDQFETLIREKIDSLANDIGQFGQ